MKKRYRSACKLDRHFVSRSHDDLQMICSYFENFFGTDASLKVQVPDTPDGFLWATGFVNFAPLRLRAFLRPLYIESDFGYKSDAEHKFHRERQGRTDVFELIFRYESGAVETSQQNELEVKLQKISDAIQNSAAKFLNSIDAVPFEGRKYARVDYDVATKKTFD